MKKEFYLYVNGQKVKVSEEIYKVYWREREHEKYLEQVDRKNHLLFFSSLDHDGHYVDNIVDESVDVAKIVETQMMIESLRYAISKLNDEERDIIERLYFNDETLRSVAKLKSITHPALMIIPAFESHRIRYAEPPNPSGGAMRNQIPFRCSEPYPTMNLRQLCRTH